MDPANESWIQAIPERPYEQFLDFTENITIHPASYIFITCMAMMMMWIWEEKLDRLDKNI
ncbi:MAG: hypothetical protein ACLTLQ_00015 [[Clostridium] scindens]